MNGSKTSSDEEKSNQIYQLCESLLVSHTNQITPERVDDVTDKISAMITEGGSADYIAFNFTAYPTALNYAASFGSPELIEILVTNGPAVINIAGGVRQTTALHKLLERIYTASDYYTQTCRNKFIDVVALFIERGADLDLTDSFGCSAKDRLQRLFDIGIYPESAHERFIEVQKSASLAEPAHVFLSVTSAETPQAQTDIISSDSPTSSELSLGIE